MTLLKTVKMTSRALGRTKDNKMSIYPPQIVNGEMAFGKSAVKTLRFICQAPYVMKDGTIDICRNPMKTVVGGGTGDQTEIIECGKCRSQYIIRTQYNAEGHLHFSTSVWDIGRKTAELGKFWTDKITYDSSVEFAKVEPSEKN